MKTNCLGTEPLAMFFKGRLCLVKLCYNYNKCGKFLNAMQTNRLKSPFRYPEIAKNRKYFTQLWRYDHVYSSQNPP